MKTLSLTNGASALVVVAHPDDETIWFGGAMHRWPQVRWTILSLCRASDADRAPKFKKVCAHYGAEGIIADLDDEDKLTIAQTVPAIKKIIKQELKGRTFDYLFTHGANGEYGHPRHIGAHLAVKNLLNTGLAGAAFFFNYKKIAKYSLAPKADSQYILKLNPAAVAAKKKVMTEIYGFAADGIDTGYCTKIEAFITTNKNYYKHTKPQRLKN